MPIIELNTSLTPPFFTNLVFAHIQLIISTILFYWIAPQQIFTQSQKKSRWKILKIPKVRDTFRKKPQLFWDFRFFEDFHGISNISFENLKGNSWKSLKSSKNRKSQKKLEIFRKVSLTLGIFKIFHRDFFLRLGKNLLRSDSIK